MAKVRSGSGEKWARRAGQSTEDFLTGVQNPRADWKTATLAATANQQAGVLEAIKNKSFEKGVAKAGSSKWLEKTLEKGAQRFAAGVQQAQADYDSAIAPYLSVIESTTLPPRYPKGDPRNIDRVKAINIALRKKKLGQ